MEEKGTGPISFKNLIAICCLACGAALFVIPAVLLAVFAVTSNQSVGLAGGILAILFGIAETALAVAYYLINKRELKKLEYEKDEAVSARNRVVSDVSRNIRTPMTSIIGLTDIAAAHIDDKKYVLDCLDKISVSGKQIVNVINGLPDVESGAADADGESAEFSFEGVRILVAEDNDLNWQIAENLLTGAGMVCDRAENGQVCLDKLLAKKPCGYDAILMDLRMPVMDGLEATKFIRTLKRGYNSIPIIAMTADALSEDVKKCFDCGMNAHIAKPIEIEALKAVLVKFLKKD